MASTTSTLLQLELMVDGENTNTWGVIANRNFETLERATSGYSSVAIAGTTTTLTNTPWTVGTWHDLNLKLTGTLTANSVVVVPTQKKTYIVENATTGAFTLTVKTSAGTGVAVPQGQRALLSCDGTNVVGIVLQAYSTGSMPTGGGTATGTLNMADFELIRPQLKDYALTVNARGSISGAQTLDMTLGNYVTATIAGATTFTFSNPPATGIAGGFVLVLTNGGSAVVTWPASVKWPAATAPTLTSSGVDVLAFITNDAGTTWRGVLSQKGSA